MYEIELFKTQNENRTLQSRVTPCNRRWIENDCYIHPQALPLCQKIGFTENGDSTYNSHYTLHKLLLKNHTGDIS